MKGFISISLIALSFSVSAQSELDSLWTVWKNSEESDSVISVAFMDYISKTYLFNQPDTAYVLADQLKNYSEEKESQTALAFYFQIKGIALHIRGDFSEALKFYTKAETEYDQLQNQQGLSDILNNKGIIYQVTGNYVKALDHHLRNLAICDELNDTLGHAYCYNSLGNIYNEKGDFKQALEYLQKALPIYEQFNDVRGVAACISNIGNNFMEFGDYGKALEYYNRSIEFHENMESDIQLANALGNAAGAYSRLGEKEKAIDYCNKSLEISNQAEDEYGMASTYYLLGNIYRRWDEHEKSIEYCLESLKWAEKVESLSLKENACNCLYEGYRAVNEGEKALIYLERGNALSDSLQTKETNKKLQQMEFEKQMHADSLANAEEARLVEEAHKEEVRKKNRARNIAIGGGLFLFLIVGGIYSRLRYTRKAKAEIEKEKDRSENLLLNILPEEIAEELKEKGRADAREFERVSILFTDFKGFTAASEKLSAQDLVTEINACFEAFDGIMGKYGIEKIKTIGDAYMAAGGLPVPTDDSVKNTVLAAMEMQEFIRTRKAKLDAEGKPGFEMRVGVHTGPVVAGIVGVKKFQYDIWGDTVNTASRMESSGEVGKVNISEATYELLKDDSQFSFESRGKVEAKGKGEMEMYFISQKG